MGSLLNFIYRNRVAGYFLMLQLICISLILSTDSFYGATFFNSSNAISGVVNNFSQNSSDYFSLRTINKNLALENSELRKQLAELSRNQSAQTLFKARYAVVPGRVIGNTYRRSRNFLTLGVGSDDGIEEGMGVVNGLGVIGQVLYVSNNFSTVASLLNPSVMISSEISGSGTLCTSQWDGKDFRHVTVKYVPRHISVEIGDTIKTSGFNSVYPPGVLVGIVDSVLLLKESPFYTLRAKLTTDFSSISHAYVISGLLKNERDSLVDQTIDEL